MQIRYQIENGEKEVVLSNHYSAREGKKAFEALRNANKALIVSNLFNRFTLSTGESYSTR